MIGYSNPVSVFAFNAAEGWTRDVSEDIAHEIRRRCDLKGNDLPANLQSFLELHESRAAHLSSAHRAACEMMLEGLVSKRRDSRYSPRPSRDWMKVKNPASPAMNRARNMF